MTDKKHKPMENRMKKIAMKPWRRNVLKRSAEALVVLEFVLSVIFSVLSYLTGNVYFKGVAVGLRLHGLRAVLFSCSKDWPVTNIVL